MFVYILTSNLTSNSVTHSGAQRLSRFCPWSNFVQTLPQSRLCPPFVYCLSRSRLCLDFVLVRECIQSQYFVSKVCPTFVQLQGFQIAEGKNAVPEFVYNLSSVQKWKIRTNFRQKQELLRTMLGHFMDSRTFIRQKVDKSGHYQDKNWTETYSGHILDKLWTYIGCILDMDIFWTKLWWPTSATSTGFPILNKVLT